MQRNPQWGQGHGKVSVYCLLLLNKGRDLIGNDPVQEETYGFILSGLVLEFLEEDFIGDGRLHCYILLNICHM